MEVFVLFLYHFIVDMFGGAFKPLIPVVMERFSLDTSTITIIISTMGMITSMSQLLFGFFGDKKSSRNFLLGSCMLTVAAISTMWFIPNVWIFFAILFIAQTGVAAFHPMGAKFAGSVIKKSVQMSYFSIGGSLGSAFSPLIITVVFAAMGNYTFLPLAVISIILLIVFNLKLPKKIESSEQPKSNNPGLPKELFTVWLLTALRTVIMVVISTYTVILLERLSGDIRFGGILLTIGLISGSLGNLVGGIIYDRIGYKNLNLIAFGGIIPLLPLLTIDSYPVILVAYSLIQFLVFMTMSTNIIYAQRVLPERAATASSISMGFGWAAGNLIFLVFGLITKILNLGESTGVLKGSINSMIVFSVLAIVYLLGFHHKKV